MAAQGEPRRQPAGKSKTDLRRGQFTPGKPGAKRAMPSREGGGATEEEQAMLFGEEPGEGT